MRDGLAVTASGLVKRFGDRRVVDGVDVALVETDGERIERFGPSGYRAYTPEERAVLARALGIGAGFAFAISLGEFGATSFLASPDLATLPILIARLLGRPGGDNYGMALAASVLLAVICGAMMLLSEYLRPRSTRTTIGGAW